MLKMPYEKRKGLYGYGFIALWLVGTIIWFLYPLLESLRYSFMEVRPEKGGMQGSWIGLDNYIYVFTADQNYSKYLVSVLIETASSCLSSSRPAPSTASSTATSPRAAPRARGSSRPCSPPT